MGALALLEQLNPSLALDLSLHDLEVFAARFDAHVGAEIVKNPAMAEYARRIEEQEEAEADEAASEGGASLPDAQDMVDELERFLREQRDSEE